MTLSLRAMEYFTTAIRHGNIARAASELNIAASAVATAIDQVEAAFGLTLVTRQRSRGIQPTASGLDVARKCERLLEEYRSLLADGTDLGQALTGTLRVGYYAPIAPAFLPQILSRFVPDPGQVMLHLEECDNDSAQDGLLNGTFDVILFVSEDVRPSIDFDTLLEAPPYCLLPQGHRLAERKSLTMADIVQEPLIVLDRPVAGAYYHALFGPHVEKVTVAAYATSTEMIRSLVGAGFGCAVLNMRPLIHDTYGGTALVEVPISDALPPLTLAIGYNKSRPRRLVRHFVNACQEHFRSTDRDLCILS